MRDSSPSKGETKGINVSEQTLIRFGKLIERFERTVDSTRAITVKVLGPEVKSKCPSVDKPQPEDTFFGRVNEYLDTLSRICNGLNEDVERLQQNF